MSNIITETGIFNALDLMSKIVDINMSNIITETGIFNALDLMSKIVELWETGRKINLQSNMAKITDVLNTM